LNVDITTTAVHAEHEAHYVFEPDIGYHIIDMRLLDLNLTAQYQLNSWVGVELVAPYRLVEVDASFLGNDMEPISDSASDIHHRDEVIQGFADLQFVGTAQIPSLVEPLNTHLSLQVGFSIPTAQTQPNPFTLGEVGLRHQHIFFGTGTYDPIGGLAFRTIFPDFDLIGWTRTKASLTENKHGYQGPTISSGALGIKTGFGLEKWSFILQQEVQHETPAKWKQADGSIENARNSGKTDLIATAGVFWSISDTMNAYALAKVPYWTQVEGGQMDIPGYASIGFQWEVPIAFSQTQEESPHSHSHKPAPTSKGSGDIQDLATGGASFDFSKAAVPGKWTVIDFWADWCEPCHIIDELLQEVANHDKNVAIRRVEVPDFDAPVFQEHLKGVPGLPVVWILDENGKIVEKLEGVSPEVVAEKLNGFLQCDSPHSPPEHEH